MSVSPPLATAQAIGLPEAAITAIQQVLAGYPEVEAVILYSSRALDRHPALLAHIEHADVELYRRPDAPD